MNSIRLTPADAGVIVSEHHGWRACLRVIEFADARGFGLNYLDRQAMKLFDEQDTETRLVDPATGNLIDPADWVAWLTDSVETYLNDHVAPEDHSFGWRDGDFRLMSKVESCDCLQCCPNLHCECADCQTPCDERCIAEMQS